MNNGRYPKKRKQGHLINHYRYNVITYPEKYVHALLLLFQPWKDTFTLKNGCEMYAECFNKVANKLENAQKYHNKFTKIKRKKEQAEELIGQLIDNLIDINVGGKLDNDDESEGSPF